ncbi:MAG: deoxyhypusine synthase family protein [Candidatus Aenigmarchaeota archaeon]|nr:deoxyhypusine synthase family protein [Candidatus Aenigmarchaeota archaeon]
MKNNFVEKKLEPIEVNKKTISELLSSMAKTGFQGKSLGRVVDIWEEMVKDKNLTIVMGYAGSLSTTGQWTIVKWLMEHRYIDVLVSTGANISEDIIPAMGFNYYQGTTNVDDTELFKSDINRYYDVYGKEQDYIKMTEFIADFIVTLDEDHAYTSREFLYLFGKWLTKKGIHSIVAAAAENGVPVFCPAIIDSPYGDAALIAKARGFNLKLDSIKEYAEFMSMPEHFKDVGVIYIGGGVPKDIIQLLAVTADLMYKDRKVPNRPGKMSRSGATNENYYPHKYAIQITTDSPQWGGLSGCTFEEATSWGKEIKGGKNVACYVDATIALPLISHALNERIGNRRKHATDFSWMFKQ